MNGSEPADGWKEHRDPKTDRVYFYNVHTKKTQWEKPEALVAPDEKLKTTAVWHEAKAADGRSYWYSKETGKSTWTKPELFVPLPSKPSTPMTPATIPATGQSSTPNLRPRRDIDDQNGSVRGYDVESSAPRSTFPPAGHNEQNYNSFEEAKAAYVKVLKKLGVRRDWTWEDTLSVAVTEPGFRSLKDPKERQAAFDEFIRDLESQDKEKEAERLEKLRNDFAAMLRTHPEIRSYTRWNTARPIIEGEAIFRAANNDDERRHLFKDYVELLAKEEDGKKAADLTAAREELPSILRELDFPPVCRVVEAQKMLDANPRFANDAKFETLSRLEILETLDRHLDARRDENFKANEPRRKDRKEKSTLARMAFRAFMTDSLDIGTIKADTMWINILPQIRDDPRFAAVIDATDGSDPLDMFHEACHEAEKRLKPLCRMAVDVMMRSDFVMQVDCTLDQFMNVVQADPQFATMDRHPLKLVFDRVMAQRKRQIEEDRQKGEEEQRKNVDRIYRLIRDLDEPRVRIGDVWEHDVRPRLEDHARYREIGTEALGRAAYAKVMLRLREKESGAERSRSKRTDRAGHDSRASENRRHKDSPEEADAYEADRKKHVAARERQYRKSSTTGPSPTHERRRDTREWDRYGGGRLSGGNYEDERRQRDMDRERAYRSWDDIHEAAPDPLNYGESGRAGSMSGSSSRRPRQSEGHDSDHRASKRLRRTPGAHSDEEKVDDPEGSAALPGEGDAEKDVDEVSMKSGSEEGEIEET